MTAVSETEPIISVIIPVYNVEKYLKRCIESVIHQSYSNLDIVLVDDGSTDHSRKICEDYQKKDKRIFVIHKQNGGLSDARNIGMEKSKGKYFYFLDSDDYIEKDCIRILYQSLLDNNADISMAGHNVIYETGKIIHKDICETQNLSKVEIFERLLYDNGVEIAAWNKLYDKKLFKNIKFPVGRLYEDAATTYQLFLAANKISSVKERLYNYCIQSQSISHCTFNSKKMDLILSTKEMCDCLEIKFPMLKKACDRRMMYAYLSTLSQLASCNEKNLKEEKVCMDYVKMNSKNILKDKKIPKRDRLALYSLKFGFPFFKVTWNLYRKWSKRI